MERRNYYRTLGIVLAAIVFITGVGFMINPALAIGTLTSAYDRLNRVQSGLTTGVTHSVVFTPATTVSGGTDSILELQFPLTDSGKWCQTAGTTTVAVDTENSATGLPGTLTGNCSKGNGSTTSDTLLVCSTGSNTWTSGQLYGVTISGSTGILGTTATTSNNIVVNLITGTASTCSTSSVTTADTGSVALATLASDQVAVTATVPPLLSFSVSNPSVGFGTLTTANAYYADASSTATTSEPTAGQMTGVTASTNAPNGLIISASDSGNGSGSAGLYKSASPSHLMAATSANAVAGGSESYGLFVDNLSSLSAASGWGSGKSGATNTLTTAAQTIITASGAISSGTGSVGLVAGVSPTTPAGAYTDSITLTSTGKF